MDTKELTKSQRLETARKYFAQVEEYETWAATTHLANEFDITVEEARAIITSETYIPEPKIKMVCHYCGMLAYNHNWFGVPVCKECGG